MRYLGFIHFPDVVVTIDLTVDGPIAQFVDMLIPRELTKQGDKNQSSLFDSILKTTGQGTPRKRGDVGGKGGAVS